jgi:DNA-directed RNA polymerase subunit RPC12/RpoP
MALDDAPTEAPPAPLSLVRMAFARNAALSALAGRPRRGSDDVEELAAFVLVEIVELAMRGIAPSRTAYRLAAWHGVRSLWFHSRGVDRASCELSDDYDSPHPCGRDHEVASLFRLIAARVRARLDERNRQILDAHLAGFSAPEIAATRGETQAAVEGALQRIFVWMADESGPARPRRAEPKPSPAPRQCADCAAALVVPKGQRSPPRRCPECQYRRRLAAQRAYHAAKVAAALTPSGRKAE